MGLSEGSSLDIYLIGSFYGFRDRIIEALPEYNILDARKHRQSSTAKTVVDDMDIAMTTPVSMVVFPKGKARGVMTYAEIGAGFACGNALIVVDENEETDPLIESIVRYDQDFWSIDDAIDYLRSAEPEDLLPKNKPEGITSKYPLGWRDAVPVDSVLFCGNFTDNDYLILASPLSKAFPDRNFTILADVGREDLKGIDEYDLIIANFPGSMDWDRHAAAMLGAAYAHDISTIVCDGHDIKYPPLQGLARRQMSLPYALRYAQGVEDLRIDKESAIMYNLFKEQ